MYMMAVKFLTQDQLIEYVTSVAKRPKLWKHLVTHGKKRGYQELADTPAFNCWVVTLPGISDTGLHDHDGSAGGVICVEGEVEESRLCEITVLPGDGKLLECIGETTQVYKSKETFQFGPWDIHRVRHKGTKPAVTIHAYSPPLVRMGSYGFGDHEFKRMPMGTEELRPLEIAIKDVH